MFIQLNEMPQIQLTYSVIVIGSILAQTDL